MAGDQETKFFLLSQKGRWLALLTCGLLLLVCGFPLPVHGQTLERLAVPFFAPGASEPLPLALVGGLNNPQPGNLDLNNDGVADLLVFDRAGHTLIPLLNTPAGYRYDPTYRDGFPDLEHWVLLRDFNGDGIADMFTYSDRPGVEGIRAFTGFYRDNRIAFRPLPVDSENNLLTYPLPNGGATPIFVGRIDYPEVADMDCDGDLDLLTFNVAGGYVELYRNRSVEDGFQRDSLRFELADDCWGGFFESGVGKEVDLAPGPGLCYGRDPQNPGIQVRHAGSTLLTMDLDGDQVRDLVLGDLSFRNLNYLSNAGTCQEPWIDRQDVAFPSTLPVDLAFFPAAFLTDITRDGRPELIACPNALGEGENRHVLQVYENLNPPGEAPLWAFLRDDALVGDMVDRGKGFNPTFADVDQDGLLDLVAGNEYTFTEGNQRLSTLAWYRNVGSAQAPAYRLEDPDFLNMSRFNPQHFGFAPNFADLDGDGDLDLVVGEEFGALFVAFNSAGPGQPMAFGSFEFPYKNIDVGFGSVPAVGDVTGDGLPDLIVGEQGGNINAFFNRGAPEAPDFRDEPNEPFWGFVDTRQPGSFLGYSAPVLVLRDDLEPLLLTGTQAGNLELYPISDAVFFPPLETDYGQLREGFQSRPALADIDQDRFYELAVGNQRGGLSIFQTDLPTGETVSARGIAPDLAFRIDPNPSAAGATLVAGDGLDTERATIRIWDSSGRLMQVLPAQAGQTPLPASRLGSGVYLVELITDRGRGVRRWVLRR